MRLSSKYDERTISKGFCLNDVCIYLTSTFFLQIQIPTSTALHSPVFLAKNLPYYQKRRHKHQTCIQYSFFLEGIYRCGNCYWFIVIYIYVCMYVYKCIQIHVQQNNITEKKVYAMSNCNMFECIMLFISCSKSLKLVYVSGSSTM